MESESARRCNQLRRAYGDPFLQYIFALDGQSVTPELFARQPAELVEELFQVAVEPSFDDLIEADVSYNALAHYLPRYDRNVARATELRLKAGGVLPRSPITDDEFLGEMFTYASIHWPAVTLLCGWHDSIRRMGISTGFRNQSSNHQEEVAAAFLKDEALSRLFPSPNREQAVRSPSFVSSDWQLSFDPPGMVSTTVGLVIEQMLLVSAVRLAARQLPWDFWSFWEKVVETVQRYRSLARGEEVSFPVLIGLGGLPMDGFDGVVFHGGHSLRKTTALDSHFLGNVGSGTHTVTLEIPTKLLSCSWDPQTAINSRVTELVEEKLNLIRLAIYLGTGPQRGIATTRYFTRFFSPRSPASTEIWGATVLETNHPQPDVEVGKDDVARVVGEHEVLFPLLSKAHHIILPVRRLLQAAGNRMHPTDKLVDAFIAIESLLSPGSGTEKLTQNLATVISYLLEGNADAQRVQLEQHVKYLYDARSDIVHGNRNTRDLAFDEAQQAVWLAARVLHALCLPENRHLLPMKASTRNKHLLRTALSTKSTNPDSDSSDPKCAR